MNGREECSGMLHDAITQMIYRRALNWNQNRSFSFFFFADSPCAQVGLDEILQNTVNLTPTRYWGLRLSNLPHPRDVYPANPGKVSQIIGHVLLTQESAKYLNDFKTTDSSEEENLNASEKIWQAELLMMLLVLCFSPSPFPPLQFLFFLNLIIPLLQTVFFSFLVRIDWYGADIAGQWVRRRRKLF